MSESLFVSATYSPEDNKLRLYAACRLPNDVYQKVKAMGFIWAPKQELFVAPSWSPEREDFCIEMAGEIVCEEMSLVERAEAKAARLDRIADRRVADANAFSATARRICERFAYGQPILIGHHSERKARRDQAKAQSAMRKSVDAANAVNYWHYRATGVEKHANRKSDPGVRARRIETLLTDLRDVQRDLNHAHICIELWDDIAQITDPEKLAKKVSWYVGSHLKTGPSAPHGLYDKFRKGEITPSETIDACIEWAERIAESETKARWINHLLNRLSYERTELGPVNRFDGSLTSAVLQTFARKFGAHQPTAKKQGDEWVLTSEVPLPLPLGDGKEITLSCAAWCDLMEELGYEVPDAKAALPPILNFKAKAVKIKRFGNVQELEQIELTKAEYAEIYSDYRGVMNSSCGGFRVKVCRDPKGRRDTSYAFSWVAVYLTDSKAHPIPDSESVVIEPVGEVV
jgi:hypothetical protein